jgi:hypothetical protein
MSEQEPKQSGFDSSWAAWKDRLGIAGVLIAMLLLFFFMFTDASLNFQCSVTDFFMMKCNRFDRTFKKWGDDDEKKTPGTSFVPALQYRGGKVVAIEFKAYARG